MRVLVTGSSGWLGRFLCPALRAAGHEPYGLDVAPGPHTDEVGTVADAALVRRLFAAHAFGAVLHAAALHKPDIARYPAQAFVDVNVTGTLNLLDAAAARPGTRFVFTSTTSLMISQAIREERGAAAVWLDEDSGPLAPRNIYGVTKLAAEGLCRQHALEHGVPCIVLRTARFFPEADDTNDSVPGPNLKANELLYRRAAVRDMAAAHLCALDHAERLGFGLYLVSAPTPFTPDDAVRLTHDAASVIVERFPDAPVLYAAKGWTLPAAIGRVYDGTRITRDLGFRYETRFADVLDALREGRPPPIEDDPSYVSPAIGSGLI